MSFFDKVPRGVDQQAIPSLETVSTRSGIPKSVSMLRGSDKSARRILVGAIVGLQWTAPVPAASVSR
jgi:hypothetical protein